MDDVEPKFEPPPKFKPPALVAKFDPDPVRRDYTGCLSAVTHGETVFLSVGVKPQPGDYHADKLPKIEPGRYRCWHEKGRGGVMEPVDKDGKRVEPKAAPVQPAAEFDPEHKCPKAGCPGRQSVGMPNGDGSHTHTCPQCGTSWSHGGPLGYPGTRTPSKPAVQQTPPAFQLGAGFNVTWQRGGS